MKAVFDAYDELCSLWGYAEDLETFEHANKLLLSYCASPVCVSTYVIWSSRAEVFFFAEIAHRHSR